MAAAHVAPAGCKTTSTMSPSLDEKATCKSSFSKAVSRAGSRILRGLWLMGLRRGIGSSLSNLSYLVMKPGGNANCWENSKAEKPVSIYDFSHT